MSASPALNLAAVAGITVGHWTEARTATGCTVVLAPPGGMRAGVAIRGRATGTRELDALHPRHLVGHVDAVLLTGGSAYGLGAADGVVRWLRERGRGFPVGPAGVVPIVPTAVIFDFDLAPGGRADRWPSADDAYRACEAASPAIAEGSVGAGTGAAGRPPPRGPRSGPSRGPSWRCPRRWSGRYDWPAAWGTSGDSPTRRHDGPAATRPRRHPPQVGP